MEYSEHIKKTVIIGMHKLKSVMAADILLNTVMKLQTAGVYSMLQSHHQLEPLYNQQQARALIISLYRHN